MPESSLLFDIIAMLTPRHTYSPRPARPRSQTVRSVCIRGVHRSASDRVLIAHFGGCGYIQRITHLRCVTCLSNAGSQASSCWDLPVAGVAHGSAAHALCYSGESAGFGRQRSCVAAHHFFQPIPPLPPLSN
jgi:hypothetical protein